MSDTEQRINDLQLRPNEAAPPGIYLIDDDPEVLESLRFLLSTLKLPCRYFDSGEAFLRELKSLSPGCVLLDIKMVEMDGFAVREVLTQAGIEWPVILMTGAADVSLVRAVRTPAVDLLIKPFKEEEMVRALGSAFQTLRQLDHQTEPRLLSRMPSRRQTIC